MVTSSAVFTPVTSLEGLNFSGMAEYAFAGHYEEQEFLSKNDRMHQFTYVENVPDSVLRDMYPTHDVTNQEVWEAHDAECVVLDYKYGYQKETAATIYADFLLTGDAATVRNLSQYLRDNGLHEIDAEELLSIVLEEADKTYIDNSAAVEIAGAEAVVASEDRVTRPYPQSAGRSGCATPGCSH